MPWYNVPHLSKEFIEQEKQTIPEAIFRMEYECQFLSDEDSNAFNLADLDACLVDNVEVLAI